jgi:O-antigen/teichoic acid export membrane protein
MWVRARGNRKLVQDGLIVSLGQIGLALGAVINIRILTEVLEPAVLGTWTLVFGIVTLGEGLAVNPVMQALLRYYASHASLDDLCTLRAQATRMLKAALLVLVVVAILGATGYGLVQGAWGYVGIALLVSIMIAVDSALSTELALFNAANRHRPLAFWRTMDAWARPILAGVSVAALGQSLSYALAGYVLGAIVVWSMVLMFSKREGLDRTQSCPSAEQRDVKRTLLRYALPLMPLAIVAWFSNWSDRYVIGGLLSLEDVGIYSVAYGIASRPVLMLCGVLDTTLRPRYFEAVSAGDRKREEQIFSMWVALICGAIAVLMVGFLFFSQPIARLLVSERYQGAAWLMPWIAGGYGLLAISQVLASICYAKLATRLLLLIESVGAVSRVLVVYPAITYAGLFGAAISVPSAFGVQLLASMMVWRFLSSSGVESRLHEAAQGSIQLMKS